MKIIFFCENPYALSINKPIHDVAVKRNFEALWYIPENVLEFLNFKVNHTKSIKDLKDFKADAIIVPGNVVPHYLRGLKVQIFHGFAGEKKGHFRIRQYFDLYLTQGPYFTRRFKELSKKHKDFDVIETGWSKLDPLYELNKDKTERERLLIEYSCKNIILYAPTFSPKLTSAGKYIDEIFTLANDRNNLLVVKFHDLMNRDVAEKYKKRAKNFPNVLISEEKSILPALVYSDVMISDTSSVVYEFMILDKPVITINTRSKNPQWQNINSAKNLDVLVKESLLNDKYSRQRRDIISEYHPYNDGNSSERMLDEIESYLKKNGVPEYRKLNLYRRWKINNKFGKF